SAELREVLTFLDTLLQTLNNAIPDNVVSEAQIAAYKADVAGARTSVTAALSGLITAKQTLQNAQTSSSGGSSTSAAAIKQAEAGLAAARANLEHTIIRAPISGTINSLSLKRGDYAQLGSAVLTVANNNALEVVLYVNESDARELGVGSTALVNEKIKGVITRIAPAIDPATKKIEVRVGLPALPASGSSSDALVNGQSVTVELAHATSETPSAPTRLVIPLSALKIGVDDVVVYTVADDFTLVSHPVVLGTLMGDRVEITEGLTADMRIVVDARGLRVGETVVVK
ncbi:efflux RND transporter periplasmic adaptor subunit, partial [Acetobacteraceae bacterium]|nr:efflux RND transporter periplasmic adaptor subunit [Candidatus Parcubacteria bacterium]